MEKTDHDILNSLVGSFNDFKLNVNEKFADIKSDIKELKDGILNRVYMLEREKADRKELDEIQMRINNVQKHLNENVEIRINNVEDWRIKRNEQIIEENRRGALYFKITLGLGLLILGMIIFHLTGYHI